MVVVALLASAGCASAEAERDAISGAPTSTGESITSAVPSIPEVTEPPPPSSEPAAAASTTTTEVPPTTTAEPVIPAGFESVTTSAMGGLRISYDPALHLVNDGDFVGLFEERPSSHPWRADVFFAIVTESTGSGAIQSLDDLLANARSIEGAQVTETDEVIELFERRLVKYEFTAGPFSHNQPIFRTRRLGVATASNAWTPFPRGELYLGETAHGVLAVGWTAQSDDEAEDRRAMFEQVLPTLQLTGDIHDAPAQPETFEVESSADRPEPGAPVDGVRVVDDLYFPLKPGLQQFVNLGHTFTVDMPPAWMVQPNFSGFVVLTPAYSFGPSNSGISMRSAFVGAQFGGPDLAAVGPVHDLRNIDEFVANAPDPLMVSEVDETEVGGLPASVFELSFRPDVDCSAGAPCVLVAWTAEGLTTRFNSGFTYRIYTIESDARPLSIVVAANHDDFFDDAEAVLATMQFAN